MIRAVPNPAVPRQLRPVELITDRAKRYRANRNPPPGPKRCGFCAVRPRRIDIDHIDGDEGNDRARNKMYLCRSCNTRKGIVQARAGAGRRTAQFNPDKAPTFAEYVNAVFVLRGDKAGGVHRAAQVLQATPEALRVRYGDRIESARNPQAKTGLPTYAEYAAAVATHSRGSHDAAGAVIHATPPALRSEYARRFAATKRSRAASVRLEW